MDELDDLGVRTMDESLFYQLLERQGVVLVGIVRLENYFAPFVTFCAGDGSQCIEHGAIVRGKSDVLAAKTVRGVIDLIHDLAGGSPRAKVILPQEGWEQATL